MSDMTAATETLIGPRNYQDVKVYEAAGTRDAFARLRVSSPYTLFDSKQTIDNQPLFWSDVEASGSGTSSTYTAAGAKTALGVSASTAGSRVRQTKRRFNYQTGKAHLILITGNFVEAKTGVTKQMGYFDANNGVFFQLSGSTFSVVKRNGGSDTTITQDSFNGDKCDGTGVSGLTFDPTKVNLLFIEFQWLGVGFIRLGYVSGENYIVMHTFYHAGLQAGISMQTPNLPIRYAITNGGTGGATTLDCICATVASEAGTVLSNKTTAVDRGITGFATGGATSIFPLISIRLNSTHLSAAVAPVSFNIITTTTVSFRWALLLNPTVAGVDAASWATVTNSAVQYDITRSTTNTLSGGTQLASGYVFSSTSSVISTLETFLYLGSTVAGVSDEMILAVQTLSATPETFFASLTYKESV